MHLPGRAPALCILRMPFQKSFCPPEPVRHTFLPASSARPLVSLTSRPDITTPMEETVRAFNWLIDQGKAFYWGTSEWSSQQISQAMEIAKRLHMVGPAAEQPHYSMMHRERFEQEYAPIWAEGFGS